MSPRRTAFMGYGLQVARAVGIALGIIILSFFLIRVVPGDVVNFIR